MNALRFFASVPTHIMLRAALKLRLTAKSGDDLLGPNTHYAACGFVQIGVEHKKALHLPLGERNAFRMQLIRYRVLTQIHTNDRIEIQKGHCLAVAPITSEISPPGFGRRKAGFSLLSFHGYNQHGEHYEKC